MINRYLLLLFFVFCGVFKNFSEKQLVDPFEKSYDYTPYNALVYKVRYLSIYLFFCGLMCENHMDMTEEQGA